MRERRTTCACVRLAQTSDYVSVVADYHRDRTVLVVRESYILRVRLENILCL